MDFSLTDDQIAFRDAVRETLLDLAPDDVLAAQHGQDTGYLPKVWEELARAGWLGLCIPEDFGGAGAAISDTAVVLEEFGRRPLPQLFVVATALSPALILEAAGPDQRDRWLPRMASGEDRITVALSEQDNAWTAACIGTTVAAAGDRVVLNGRKNFVPDAAGATHLLVLARVANTDRLALVLVKQDQPGVKHRVLDGFVSWQSEVVFDDVSLSPDQVLGSLDVDVLDAVDRAVHQTIPLLCSYQVGSCQSVFEMSLRHTRTRVQFGQPIGRFQRVQDHVIGLVNQLDAARWATYEAVWLTETTQPSALASVHMTKSIVSEAHWACCDYGHEIHAGLGADITYPLARHTYLSRGLYHFLGEPRWHRARMVAALNW